MKTKVSIVKCDNYDPDLVFNSTKKAIDLIGGVSTYIKPGSSVFVNPNLLLAIEPDKGVDTHPAVVRAVVKILKEIHCKIYLGDGPSAWGAHAENIDNLYKVSGMWDIAKEENIELVKFDQRRWRGNFPLTTWLDKCDYLVSIPKFKTHNLTLLTGAVKNLYGLVTGTYKAELHKRYFETEEFSNILIDIYQEAKPTLTIVDGIVAMEGEGPGTSGTLRQCGFLFAGADCLALDSILAYVMGLAPEDIPTNIAAKRRGIGVTDLSLMEILGEGLEDIKQRPFELPSASSLRKRLPEKVIGLLRNLIRFYPHVTRSKCVLCGSCIQTCPQKIISKKKDHIIIDYTKCISCFCCQEVCPHSAIKLKKSILARLLGL